MRLKRTSIDPWIRVEGLGFRRGGLERPTKFVPCSGFQHFWAQGLGFRSEWSRVRRVTRNTFAETFEWLRVQGLVMGGVGDAVSPEIDWRKRLSGLVLPKLPTEQRRPYGRRAHRGFPKPGATP